MIKKTLFQIKYLLIFSSTFLLSSVLWADNTTILAKYFRYYDSNGVPTVSTSVTPTHLRKGYDELDQNMMLIRHVNASAESANSHNSNVQKLQYLQAQRADQIQRAYPSLDYAQQKKQETLSTLLKQLSLFFDELKQQRLDRHHFLIQKNKLSAHSAEINKVNQALNTNMQNIAVTRQNIEQVKSLYLTQESYFNDVIAHLKNTH